MLQIKIFLSGELSPIEAMAKVIWVKESKYTEAAQHKHFKRRIEICQDKSKKILRD